MVPADGSETTLTPLTPSPALFYPSSLGFDLRSAHGRSGRPGGRFYVLAVRGTKVEALLWASAALLELVLSYHLHVYLVVDRCSDEPVRVSRGRSMTEKTTWALKVRGPEGLQRLKESAYLEQCRCEVEICETKMV